MLFLERERGQGLMEYGLVLVLVAVVIVAILTVLGPQIGNMFSRITVCIPPTDLC
jgi:pilus assembly protein Flp/PilA